MAGRLEWRVHLPGASGVRTAWASSLRVYRECIRAHPATLCSVPERGSL